MATKLGSRHILAGLALIAACGDSSGQAPLPGGSLDGSTPTHLGDAAPSAPDGASPASPEADGARLRLRRRMRDAHSPAMHGGALRPRDGEERERHRGVRRRARRRLVCRLSPDDARRLSRGRSPSERGGMRIRLAMPVDALCDAQQRMVRPMRATNRGGQPVRGRPVGLRLRSDLPELAAVHGAGANE
jgi:hypothetical protein